MKTRVVNDPGGKTLPVKFRFLKPGVMMFTPSLKERALLAMGYTIRVDVLMKMQHNPGVVDVASSWKPVETIPGADMPKIEALPPREDGS